MTLPEDAPEREPMPRIAIRPDNVRVGEQISTRVIATGILPRPCAPIPLASATGSQPTDGHDRGASAILAASDRCESNSNMTQQRQSFGPGRVLAQVTLIVVLPLMGGVIVGLVADGNLGTAPLFVLSGLAIGTLVTALWLRWFIRTNMARLRGGDVEVGPGAEQHEQSTTERT